MGKYMIVITGHGLHHNQGRNQKDADVMARDFVESLKNAGHTIEHASFSNGMLHRSIDVSAEQHKKNVQVGQGEPISPEIANLAVAQGVSNTASATPNTPPPPGGFAGSSPVASVPGSVAAGSGASATVAPGNAQVQGATQPDASTAPGGAPLAGSTGAKTS